MEVLVANVGDVPIPNPQHLSRTEMGRLVKLKRRAHLEYADDRRKLDPLDEKEQGEYDDLVQRHRDTNQAQWGSVHVQFAPAGQPGSILILRDDIANTVIGQHPMRLQTVDMEKVPRGVKPVRPSGRIPSRSLLSFGTDDLNSLPTSPLSVGVERGARTADNGVGGVNVGDGWMAEMPQPNPGE
jgi:hypothetical protein